VFWAEALFLLSELPEVNVIQVLKRSADEPHDFDSANAHSHGNTKDIFFLL
jgi:hypothetical protein